MGTLCVNVSVEQGTNLDLDVVAAKNRAFKLTRTSERQEMVILNDRLAVYIKKARTRLEQFIYFMLELFVVSAAFGGCRNVHELLAKILAFLWLQNQISV